MSWVFFNLNQIEEDPLWARLPPTAQGNCRLTGPLTSETIRALSPRPPVGI